MKAIRSERLTLRLMTPDDIDTFVAYRSDPTTLALMKTRIPPTHESVRATVDAMAALGGPTEGEWIRLAITLNDDGDGNEEMIGDVVAEIEEGGGIAQIGYALRPDVRGNGYASEATAGLVDHLIARHAIHRIEARLHPKNMNSMRVLEAVGMQFEAISRLTCDVDGELEDDLVYAMTADDRRAWADHDRSAARTVELVEVDSDNADTWARLKTHHSQEEYVAPMLRTYRDALFPESIDGVVTVPWMRGISADGTPAGFLMTTTTYGRRDGWYLWRLLIDRMHQGRGIGARAMELLFDEMRSRGVSTLFTSCGAGPGSPRPFYDRLGFEPTGGIVDDHEAELVLSTGN